MNGAASLSTTSGSTDEAQKPTNSHEQMPDADPRTEMDFLHVSCTEPTDRGNSYVLKEMIDSAADSVLDGVLDLSKSGAKKLAEGKMQSDESVGSNEAVGYETSDSQLIDENTAAAAASLSAVDDASNQNTDEDDNHIEHDVHPRTLVYQSVEAADHEATEKQLLSMTAAATGSLSSSVDETRSRHMDEDYVGSERCSSNPMNTLHFNIELRSGVTTPMSVISWNVFQDAMLADLADECGNADFEEELSRGDVESEKKSARKDDSISETCDVDDEPVLFSDSDDNTGCVDSATSKVALPLELASGNCTQPHQPSSSQASADIRDVALERVEEQAAVQSSGLEQAQSTAVGSESDDGRQNEDDPVICTPGKEGGSRLLTRKPEIQLEAVTGESNRSLVRSADEHDVTAPQQTGLVGEEPGLASEDAEPQKLTVNSENDGQQVDSSKPGR